MKPALACIVLCLAAVATGVAAEDVYRWVDDDGVVHYSDRPVGKNAERVDVRSLDAIEDAGDARAGERGGESGAAEEETRREQCERAKTRLAEYQEADRLYQVGPEGERREMSADERVKAIARVKQDVQAFCRDE